MTVSGVAPGGAYSLYQLGGTQMGVRQQMSMLFGAIQAGNLDGARSDFSALAQLLGGGAAVPFSALLGQVGTALASGNITEAQSALSDYQTQNLAGTQAPAPAAQSGTGPLAANQNELGSLIQSVQQGDLHGAQQAYAALAAANTDDTTTGRGDAVVSQLLASLGAALSNSNIAAAQRNLTAFAQTQGVGAVLDVAA